MKKKILCLAFLAGLLISGTMTAYAKDAVDVSGNVVELNAGKWYATYTSSGDIEDNLGESINDQISTMQPGDKVSVEVALKNENSTPAHWYMKNTITKSMEVTAAMGGSYTYELAYTDPSGVRTVLYTSETVGGDPENGQKNEGLLEVDSRLGDYFYLGAIASGQSGRIDLTVGLDGETQGNSYQDKVANLSMNFAVEPQPQISGGGGKTHHRTVTREVINNEVVYLDEDGVPLADVGGLDIVKTSDEMNLLPYVLAACISGFLLLIVAFLGMKNRREEKEGGAVR